MMIRDIDDVFGIEYVKTQFNGNKNWTFVLINKNSYLSLSSSFTTIPHIIITVGLINMLVCIIRSVKKYVQDKKEPSQDNIAIS